MTDTLKLLYNSMGIRNMEKITPNPPSDIKTKITLLATSVVFVSLLLVALLLGQFSFVKVESFLDKHIMDIARTVAQIPEVKQSVGTRDGYRFIQPITENIRKETDAEYIIVFDLNGIRYTHPDINEIGGKLKGWDWEEALKGKKYIVKTSSSSGPILRAFIPVYNEKKQVGAVLVGMLLKNVNDLSVEIRFSIIAVTIVGLLIGMIGSSILADNIKNTMLNLEPYEIATFFQEFEAVLESVREAIIAVDSECKITIVNSEARRMLRIDKTVRGMNIQELIPDSRLPEVIESGEPQFDHEQNIGETRVLGNKLPINFEGKVIGAIASYRDITEILTMAEEFTGVKEYVEALRVQNHEFSNKMHTLSGLIQLGDYHKALEYISTQTDIHKNILSFISKRIQSSAVAGLLIGKRGKSLEMGIDFTIDNDSNLGEVKSSDATSLVVVIGNLLDNAMTAVNNNEKHNKKIFFSIFHEFDKIYISVIDNGHGITGEVAEKIYDKGFTTKKNYNSGYGLYLIKSIVDSYNGEINFETNSEGLTEFIIILPIKEE